MSAWLTSLLDGMEFRLLGPVDALIDGKQVDLGRRQERRLLGLLLLETGRVVGIDRLVSLLWEGEAPSGARATVHTYVARLRGRLSPHGVRLITRGEGYLADVPDQAVDAHRFATLVAEAEQTANAVLRAERFGAALALWRGPLMADVASDSLRERIGARLNELRLHAVERRAEADLVAGRHGQVVTDLAGIVEQNPTRERLVELLMTALYRGGRQADALTAYQNTRRVLGAELGIDTGPELRRLHESILRGEFETSHSEATPVAPPAQLPLDVHGFTGRSAELDHLDALLTASDDQPTAVVISAVSGTAGVGKTALAVHWAHRVRDRFPGGQLYVNLRGFDPVGSPMTPAEAIRGFLDAFHVPTHRMPVSLDAQAALYRSMVANRRVLVVLDNARDADQVRPLLPGSPGCVVLVTSRDQLAGLVAAEGARPLTVDLLATAEARELLSRRIGPEVLTADRAVVDEIITRCARLPLALAIMGARAATRGSVPLEDIVSELRSAGGGLDVFAGNDAVTDVRAVFACSYRTLSAEAARLFRLLGLYAGPDIGAAACASLAGRPPEQVRALLAELTRANLLVEQASGRFVLHDLLHAYANELTAALDPPTERRTAVHRLLDHYLHTSFWADHLINPIREQISLAPPCTGVTPESLSDTEQALVWFAAERPALMAVIEQAVQGGFDEHAWQLPRGLATYLDRHGPWHEKAANAMVALAAAGRLGNRLEVAEAYLDLGRSYVRLERFDDAVAAIERALGVFTELEDLSGQARAHRSVASAYERQGRDSEALHHTRCAYDLHVKRANEQGQAIALNAMGWYYARLGEYRHALRQCGRALVLLRRLGHRQAEAATWDSLGYAHHSLGGYGKAIACYRRAIELYQGVDDPDGMAETLRHIGDTYHASGDFEQARHAWQSALQILESVAHPDMDEVRAKLAEVDTPSPTPR
jgi:DNA-binding SARP family transcriptional activator/tetratricopeptide (TPR) repeat protein